MQIPKCCNKRMKSRIETTRFMEVECAVCGDVIYLKKHEVDLPQLLDD